MVRDKKKLLIEIESFLKEIKLSLILKLRKKFIKKFNKRHDDKETKKIKFLLQVALPLNIRRKI